MPSPLYFPFPFTYYSESLMTVAGLMSLAITFFGWSMAYRVRRPMIFRWKLAIVFVIPFILAVSYLCPFLTFSHTYRILLVYTFIFLLSVLYWRELRKVSTSAGYHKAVLVNFLDIVPDIVWMKDKDNRFTYTNKAACEKLLLCTPEEAFGKTGLEIAEMQRQKGRVYTFGEACCNSDSLTIDEAKPCRFMEFGDVDGKFLALQVFKAPLYSTRSDGSVFISGTIGMGRDLTYDFLDHERISYLCKEGRLKEAITLFEKHKQRYKYVGPECDGKRFTKILANEIKNEA